MSKTKQHIKYFLLIFLLHLAIFVYAEHETAYMFSQAPIIDGKIDDNWDKFKWVAINEVLISSPISKNDLSGNYKIAWINDSLYILLSIIDDYIDSSDKAIINFDFGNDKNQAFNSNDFTINLYRNNEEYLFDLSNKIYYENSDTTYPINIAFNFDTINDRYIYEIVLNITNFNIPTISELLQIGFNIELIDWGKSSEKHLIWSQSNTETLPFFPNSYGTIIYYTKTDISALGANTGSIDISIFGGNPPYNISWSNGSKNKNLFNISKGKYIITVTDILNNTAIDTIEIIDKSTLICYSNNVSIKPVIDGKMDDIWNLSKTYKIQNFQTGNASLSTQGQFQTLFSNGFLYFLVKVKDDNLFNNLNVNYSERDHITFYFDWGNDKLYNTYDLNDFYINYNWSYPDSLWVNKNLTQVTSYPITVFQEETIADSNEYILEIAFDVEDWWNETIDYTSNIEVGFDIKINDEEIDNNYEEAIIFWNSEDFTNYKNPAANGLLLINNGITIAYDIVHATNQTTYDGAIDITIHGGQPPYKYEWSAGDTTQDLNNCKIGFYNLIVTDNIGNVAYAAITVGIYNILPEKPEEDTICSIKGHVLDNITPINESMVILYKYQLNEYKAIASNLTNYEGEYFFNNLKSGQYLLYAIPNSSNYNNYLPTYYVNNINWQNAHPINLTGDAFNVDINLIKNNIRSNNDGIISGNVIYEDTLYYEKTIYDSFNNQTLLSDCNNIRNAAPNIPVFLIENGSPVAWTLSKQNGNFEFHKLNHSYYNLTAQKAGFEMANTVNISITEDKNKYNNVLILIGDNKIKSWLINNNICLHVFPVPANEYLIIDFENYSFNNFSILIYNSLGELVKTKTYFNNYLSRNFELNIKDLSIGQFYGIVRSNSHNASFRFSKINR